MKKTSFIKKFTNFIDKLASSCKWNIFIISMFSIFAIIELIEKDYLFAGLDILIVMSETLALKTNIASKKLKKIKE